MKKTLLIFLLLAKNSFACEDCFNWQTLKYAKFEINYPSSWTLNEEGELGTVFILYSHLEDKNDSFKENLSLITYDFSNQKTTLNQYTESTLKQIKKQILDCKITSNIRHESNGKEYQKITYTGRHGKYNLQYVQCIWMNKTEVYALTYTCEIDKIDKYKFKTDKIIESFYLKD